MVWEAFNAYQKTAAIRAAIELDLFTRIGEGASTAALIAASAGVSPRGIRILCDYLVVTGFLAKSESSYALTPTAAAFLDRRSPSFMGAMIAFMNAPKMMQGFENLPAAIRLGGTTLAKGGVTEAELDEWVIFAKSMAAITTGSASFLAQVAAQSNPKRVIDLAAGHGMYGIAVARALPECRVVAQDWGKVLAVAEANARAADVLDRYSLLAGDTFTVDYGSGYDLALVTNLLHHFDSAACVKLLEKIRAALAPGGRVLVLEFVPDEDRVSPPAPAAFSLTMLAMTPAGDAYTFSELSEFLTKAGFRDCQLHEVPHSPQRLVTAVR